MNKRLRGLSRVIWCLDWDPVPMVLPIKPESGAETSHLASCVSFSRDFFQSPCVSNPFNIFKMFPQHLCVSAIRMHGHLSTNWGLLEASRVLCRPQSVSSVVREPLLVFLLLLIANPTSTSFSIRNQSRFRRDHSSRLSSEAA